MASSMTGLRCLAGRQLKASMMKSCVALPGAFNGLCGRLVAKHGFEGAYISGAAVTASAGSPDNGILTLDHFTRVIREVSLASGLPLLCDADTGFGEAEMVTRTVYEYCSAGAAGFHIEDQVFPKRCGHLDGKELISSRDMCLKVERARTASEKLGGDFIVCARTDAKGVVGFDEAVKRAEQYCQAGADMIFPEGLFTEQEFIDFAEAMRKCPGPAPGGGPFMLANMTEFGKTPYIPVSKFGSWGYHTVIFPVTTLRSAMGAADEVLEVIKREGSAETMLSKMQSRKNLYRTLGYTPGVEHVFPNSSTDPAFVAEPTGEKAKPVSETHT